jgi:hypothetical protein
MDEDFDDFTAIGEAAFSALAKIAIFLAVVGVAAVFWLAWSK